MTERSWCSLLQLPRSSLLFTTEQLHWSIQGLPLRWRATWWGKIPVFFNLLMFPATSLACTRFGNIQNVYDDKTVWSRYRDRWYYCLISRRHVDLIQSLTRPFPTSSNIDACCNSALLKVGSRSKIIIQPLNETFSFVKKQSNICIYPEAMLCGCKGILQFKTF